MKKSTLLLTFLSLYLLLGCSEKSVTQKSVTHSEQPKAEKSIEKSLAEDLSSLNACTVVYCLQRKRIYKH